MSKNNHKPCVTCSGTGKAPVWKDCTICFASGIIQVYERDADGEPVGAAHATTCWNCGGTGRTGRQGRECADCRGRGWH